MKFIKVKVKPGCKKVNINEEDDTLIVSLTSRPLHNKANEELVQVLKKYLNTDVKIVKGFRTKNKIIEIL